MIKKKTKRVKIPIEIEANIIFQSDRLCCIDNKKGDHIHHIDGDNSNNDFLNLALLCFDCHNEATIAQSLRKKLTARAIVKYRDHHYNVINSKRINSLKILNNKIDGLSSESLINFITSSILVVELSKIRQEYFGCVHRDRDYILNKISYISENNSGRIAFEVMNFLQKVSYETRTNIPTKMITSIFYLVMNFFPPHDIIKNKKQVIELGKMCVNIAHTIVYDSFIHVNNFEMAKYGLMILKYLHITSISKKIPKLTILVSEAFEELEKHLIRPERNDLEDAKRLLKIFKQDITNLTMTLPFFPPELFRKIQKDVHN